MDVSYSMGNYGLRTEGSLTTFACPADGFSAKPANHQFKCGGGGKWKPATALTFNGQTYETTHDFTGGHFIIVDQTTNKGIWWDDLRPLIVMLIVLHRISCKQRLVGDVGECSRLSIAENGRT